MSAKTRTTDAKPCASGMMWTTSRCREAQERVIGPFASARSVLRRGVAGCSDKTSSAARSCASILSASNSKC